MTTSGVTVSIFTVSTVGSPVEAAEKLVAGDPMNIGGAVLSHTITEWNPVLGTI